MKIDEVDGRKENPREYTLINIWSSITDIVNSITVLFFKNLILSDHQSDLNCISLRSKYFSNICCYSLMTMIREGLADFSNTPSSVTKKGGTK